MAMTRQQYDTFLTRVRQSAEFLAEEENRKWGARLYEIAHHLGTGEYIATLCMNKLMAANCVEKFYPDGKKHFGFHYKLVANLPPPRIDAPMRWTENAEGYFTETFGELDRAGFLNAYRSLRSACENEALKRSMQRWPYLVMVEMTEIETVRDYYDWEQEEAQIESREA